MFRLSLSKIVALHVCETFHLHLVGVEVFEALVRWRQRQLHVGERLLKVAHISRSICNIRLERSINALTFQQLPVN